MGNAIAQPTLDNLDDNTNSKDKKVQKELKPI